jgi:hypothetical protein
VLSFATTSQESDRIPKTSEFDWYSQNKLLLRFLVIHSNFISVTLSKQSFQALRGGT